MNTTLGHNVFDVPQVKRRLALCFVSGQPLGMYSSWPLFTLTHHFVVWLAAEIAHPGRIFRDYAILGDDVVIGDPIVAKRYEEALEQLGVTITKVTGITHRCA